MGRAKTDDATFDFGWVMLSDVASLISHKNVSA